MTTPTVINGSIEYINATQPATADVQINFTLLMNSGNTGRGQAGVLARGSADGLTGYACFFEYTSTTGGAQWLLWSYTPSADTLLNVYQIPSAQRNTVYADNATVNCIYRIHGSVSTLTVNGVDLFVYDDSSNSVPANGYSGFLFALNASGANHVQFDSWSTSSIFQSVPSIYQGVTGGIYVMTMTGIGTSWTSGTTFNVTGGTGAGISGLSVNAGTQVASFTLVSGSTPAALIIGNSSDSTTATITIVAPAAQIDTMAIGPSGNIIVLHCSDLSNNPTTVTAYSGGASIQVNGGTPIVLDPSVTPIGSGSSWLWSGLNRRYEVIVDDSDAGFVPTGSWTNTTPSGFWANQPAVWFKGNRHLSTSPSATAVYTFTGVIPGAPYRVQVNGPIDSPVGTGFYCTQATYVVHDGATVVGTFTQNQDTVSILEFDWADGNDGTEHNGHFYNLGTTSTITGTTLTVTLSNGSGSGTLVADAVRLERLISISTGGIPIVHPGDTVTLTAPGGCITTNAGYTSEVLNAPVTLWTDSVLAPYNTGQSNTMQLGYNLCSLGPDLISTPIYADRIRCPDMFQFGGPGWTINGGTGTFTTDSAGQLTGTTAGCNAKLPVCFVLTNRVDNYSVPLYARSGTWTLICKTTGSPNLTLFGGTNLIYGSGGMVQVATFTDSMGTWTVYNQTLSISDNNPNNGDLLYLGLQSSSGGGYIRYARLYGSELYTTLSANGWVLPSQFHPNTLDWLKGRHISCVRFLNRCGQGNHSDFGDIVPSYTMPEGTFDARISVNMQTRVPGANIVSISPIDTNPATDTDTAYQWFSAPNTDYPLVKITTSVPHGFLTQQIISISSLPGTAYTDNYGGPINWGACYTSLVTSPTTILAQFFVDPSRRSSTRPSNLLATISSTVTPGGFAYAGGIGNSFPWYDIINLANECSFTPHVCLYACETDDCVNKRFQYAASHLNAGLKIRVEWTNEVWNGVSGLMGPNYASLYAWKLYGSTNVYYGYSYISFRMRAIAKAGWTGTPAVFIVGDGIGAVAHATVFGGTVTSIVIDHGGSGYTSATATIVGGTGSGATANVTVSGGAVVSAPITNSGSGYTLTGRDPNDIIWMMNTAFENPGAYTAPIGSYCSAHNLTEPFELGIAPYQDNQPPSFGWVSLPVVNNGFSTLDIDGLIDLYMCHLGLPFRDCNAIGAYRGHANAISGYGFSVITSPTAVLGPNQTRIMGYEGGAGILCTHGNEDGAHMTLRAIAMAHHPRIRLALRSYFQAILQATGYSLLNVFQFSDLGNPQGATWTDKDTWNMNVGTADGTDGQYNNVNPFQQDRIVSPKGYAVREFVNPTSLRYLAIGVM